MSYPSSTMELGRVQGHCPHLLNLAIHSFHFYTALPARNSGYVVLPLLILINLDKIGLAKWLTDWPKVILWTLWWSGDSNQGPHTPRMTFHLIHHTGCHMHSHCTLGLLTYGWLRWHTGNRDWENSGSPSKPRFTWQTFTVLCPYSIPAFNALLPWCPSMMVFPQRRHENSLLFSELIIASCFNIWLSKRDTVPAILSLEQTKWQSKD